MNILDIINKKRLNKILTKEEIDFFIDGIVSGNIKDYQTSALLMAITINGMNEEETYYLTNAMLNSGEKIDLSSLNTIVVDKHSTGGVGDKTTLVLAPLVASLGVSVAKMSGRGLGHTGGTIDKLESIKGFNISLDMKEFINQVKEIGIALIGQTDTIAYADKILYALRDVTSSVESVPLIASSIMSKKLASGADKIVIDVTVGSGALMKNIESASKLSSLMINIGKRFNKKVVCVLSNMDEPLGYSIGNSLEVKEAIQVLKGSKEPKDLYDLVIKLASIMVSLAKGIKEEEATKLAIDALENNKAYNKFLEFVKYQNGDINNIDEDAKVFSLKLKKSGYIKKIDTYKLAECARKLGAGRYKKDDIIDYGVGIVLNKKKGDYLEDSEELLKIYYKNKDINIYDIIDCFVFSNEKVEKDNVIIDVIK